MKKWLFIIGTAATTVWLTGCSSSYFAAAGYGNDDLYAIHDKAEIARRQQAEAEKKKAEAEARRAEWEARLAEAEAEAVQRRYYETTSNPLRRCAWPTPTKAPMPAVARVRSPTYRMPSSYYELRYSPAYNYVTAYDPMNYNIVVMGDEVWVEPKYISSMFGSWGAPSYAVYGGWGWPYGFGYSPWGYPHYSWWDWHYDWSWNFGWGWGWHRL